MLVSAFVFSLIVLSCIAWFVVSVHRTLQPITQGKAVDRTDRFMVRLQRLLKRALSGGRPTRRRLVRSMRLILLFCGIIISTAVLEAFAEGLTEQFFPFRSFGSIYRVITFFQEVCACAVLCAVLFLLMRRSVDFAAGRNNHHLAPRAPGVLILCMIALITSFMLANNAVRIAAGAAPAGIHYPLSSALSVILANVPSLAQLMHIVWAFFIVIVLVFINLLPRSKNIAVLASIPNLFFSKIERLGTLSAPPTRARKPSGIIGAVDHTDLTWKQLLDGYACTGCGRCDDVCPARRAGAPLSPQKIISDVRKRAEEHFWKNGPAHTASRLPKAHGNPSILHGYIADEELWACTTCMACAATCPVSVEHVDAIVEFRRGLVLTETRIPPDLAAIFAQLEEHGSPYDAPTEARTAWAEGLGIKTLAEDPNHEVLFWVGCAGAFDERCRRVSAAFARLMQHAGVRFAILGAEERCTGDAARRLGNERLANALTRHNIETLQRYHVSTIVTACPHCYNTLKNEYPQFGGRYTVLHHTEFLDQLLRAGRLTITHATTEPYTYHDPCYLARGNGLTEGPRKILRSICVTRRTDLPHAREHTLCCGAGGGHIWMDGTSTKPTRNELAREIIDSGCEMVVTACPFCLTTIGSTIQTLDEASDRYVICDIAEILSSAIDEHLKVPPTLRNI